MAVPFLSAVKYCFNSPLWRVSEVRNALTDFAPLHPLVCLDVGSGVLAVKA